MLLFQVVTTGKVLVVLLIFSEVRMVKVITQETFDAVVKENVEEFGMEMAEAVKDSAVTDCTKIVFLWFLVY